MTSISLLFTFLKIVYLMKGDVIEIINIYYQDPITCRALLMEDSV